VWTISGPRIRRECDIAHKNCPIRPPAADRAQQKRCSAWKIDKIPFSCGFGKRSIEFPLSEYKMPASTAPDTFCTRLHQALDGVGFRAASPAALAREFNRHHPGAPITAHATRKWLRGEAIPTQARLRSLAAWLTVSPDWLVFGQSGHAAPPSSAVAGAALFDDLQRLDAAQRRMAQQLVRTLLKLQLARAKKRTGKHAPML
jgi:hypothetical protein